MQDPKSERRKTSKDEALAEAMVRKLRDERALDPTLIADAVVSHIRGERKLDIETHDLQHKFVQMLMDKEKAKIERRERIKEKIAGSAILTFIGGIIILLGAGVISWLRDNINNIKH